MVCHPLMFVQTCTAKPSALVLRVSLPGLCAFVTYDIWCGDQADHRRHVFEEASCLQQCLLTCVGKMQQPLKQCSACLPFQQCMSAISVVHVCHFSSACPPSSPCQQMLLILLAPSHPLLLLGVSRVSVHINCLKFKVSSFI